MIKNLRVDYEPDSDILFASIGAPVPATSIEVETGVLIRISPEKDKVVGIEILDYCSHDFHVAQQKIDQAFVSGLIERFSPAALKEWNATE